jgi:glycosyltransferase involved in cell wall biosynthesis
MRILILAYSNFNSDPRVKRQIKALQGNEIITCGFNKECNYQIYKEPEPDLFRKMKRFFFLISGQYEKWYWDDYKESLAEELSRQQYDVIIANDIPTLPLALGVKDHSGGKVYFDAHEYHPKEWENRLKWRLLYQSWVKYMCKKYIPMADLFSTVSEGIAEAYKKFTGKKPVVITNASEYEEFHPGEPSEPIKLIHHGLATPHRCIELMIDVMKYLDGNFILYLMLTYLPEDKRYFEKLKSMASDRVRFLEPVPLNKICETINKFDIGIFLLKGDNFNYLNALPNKLFEFIQARLAVAVSPNPEMARIVEQYSLGAVAKDYTPASMAEAIKKVAGQLKLFKQNADAAAHKTSAENNYQFMREFIR